MSTFWIISAAMILVATALLVPALLRQRTRPSDDTRELNVEIARERLAEFEIARKAGELSDEEFNQAKQDLEIALAQDLDGSNVLTQTAEASGARRFGLVLVVLAVPLITVLMYFEVGTPNFAQQHMASQRAQATEEGELPPIQDLLAGLEQKLEENPDNVQGWYLLGRSHMRLQRYTDAARAYERLVKLAPEDTTALLSLADALAMSQNGNIDARTLGFIEKALQIEPDNVTGLWLAGKAAADNNQPQQALEYWRRAYPLLGEDPGMQMELDSMIRQTEIAHNIEHIELAGKAPAPLPEIMSALDNVAATPPPASPPAAASGPQIDVEVALSPALLERVSEQDTVFVFAKASQGPPMPLAVVRKKVADLPIRVTLNDSMAMMPQMRLSSFPQVAVSARVSKSGQPTAQPGDFESAAQIVANNHQEPLQVLIDQPVN